MVFPREDQELREIMKNLLTGTNGEEYISHTQRVVDYSIALGRKENADLTVLVPAAILHDIGRCIDSSLKGHVEKGLVISEAVLLKLGYKETVRRILEIIADHHNNLEKEVPKSIEGEVLLDADRIEITGRIGIARWFKGLGPKVSVEQGCELFLLLSKQRRSDRATFFSTRSGEEFARNDFEYSVNFCKALLSEVQRTSSNRQNARGASSFDQR